MAKQNNLWAPWRMNYILGLDSEKMPAQKNNSDTNKDSECFICHNLSHPQEDNENLVLWRTKLSIVILLPL